MVDSNSSELQAQFIRGIEDIIPATSTLAGELMDVLEISSDSAYRRIRGETLLTIDEIVKLCEHFQISFDNYSKVKTGMITFIYNPIETNPESYAKYLDSLNHDLNLISSAKERSIVYACQDMPDFHHFNYPDLANFKFFYWMRSIMNLPDLSRLKYNADFQFDELLAVGKEIYDKYSSIPSIEVWTDTTIRSTIRQINFYWESGIFDSKDAALRVCSALSKAIDDIEGMAERESKLPVQTDIQEDPNSSLEEKVVQEPKNFKLYVSDIELTNNSILINVGSGQVVYLSQFSYNTMKTRNDVYCKSTEAWANNIIKKSTLISGVSEKQRFQFFQNINKQIDDLMKRISEG